MFCDCSDLVGFRVARHGEPPDVLAPARRLASGKDPMDITRILEADHRDVEQLLAKLSRAKGEARTPLVESITTSLRGHMELEEQVVYPAVDRVVGHEDFVEGNTEHDLVRQAIENLRSLTPDEPGFGATLAILRAGVMHHVEDEEDEVFPALRRDEGALQSMAKPFLEARLRLGLPMPASALAAASSKDELTREARAAGIDRATSMTKEELARALVKVMAS